MQNLFAPRIMAYCIAHLEVTRPLPAVQLGSDESGVALVVRRHGVPIGFVLRPVDAGRRLEPAAIEQLLLDADPTFLTPVRRPPRLRAARLPSLTAVVCTHDRPERLARCLDSLRAMRAARGEIPIELDLLVVDNAPSDDRTQAIVATLPDVRYVREPHTGLDFARNRACRDARGEFVAFFDDDVTVDPGWLGGFAAALDEHPDAAAVGGPVLPYELATPAQVLFEEFGGFGHRFTRMRFEATRPGDRTYPCSPGVFGTGCNMALRRDAVRAIGGFDEALDAGRPLPGGGDLDVFYRLVRAGHVTLVEPRCLVFHEHRREHAALRHQMWTWGLGTMAFIAKTWRTDPASRPRLRRRTLHWFGQRAKSAVAWCVGRSSMPIDVIVAMTAGGIVGLLGEYDRSRRRVARIRREIARTEPAHVEPATLAG